MLAVRAANTASKLTGYTRKPKINNLEFGVDGGVFCCAEIPVQMLAIASILGAALATIAAHRGID